MECWWRPARTELSSFSLVKEPRILRNAECVTWQLQTGKCSKKPLLISFEARLVLLLYRIWVCASYIYFFPFITIHFFFGFNKPDCFCGWISPMKTRCKVLLRKGLDKYICMGKKWEKQKEDVGHRCSLSLVSTLFRLPNRIVVGQTLPPFPVGERFVAWP